MEHPLQLSYGFNPIICLIIFFSDVKMKLAFKQTCKLFRQYVTELIPTIGYTISSPIKPILRQLKLDYSSQTLYAVPSTNISNTLYSCDVSGTSASFYNQKVIHKPFSKKFGITQSVLDIKNQILYFATPKLQSIGRIRLASKEACKILPEWEDDALKIEFGGRDGFYGAMVFDPRNNSIYVVSQYNIKRIFKISLNDTKAKITALSDCLEDKNGLFHLSCNTLVLDEEKDCLYRNPRSREAKRDKNGCKKE